MDFVRKQIDLMTASIDAIPAWSEPETCVCSLTGALLYTLLPLSCLLCHCSVMQERLQALKAEEDALDAELAQLLPTAEGTLVTARQHMDTVSKQAFDKHMELQRGVDEHDDKKQKK